jgi:signal transduction histidine kinase
LQAEIPYLLKAIAEFKQVWVEYKTSEGGTQGEEELEIEGEIEAVQHFLEVYGSVPDTYIQQLEGLLQQISLPNLQSGNIEAIRNQLLVVLSGNFSHRRIEDFDEALTAQMDFALKEYEQSEHDITAAQVLRFQLTAGSLLLSAAIAALLASYTSRAIAKPIEAVTEVAQTVTKDSNFNLQAPVMTQDEVGVLAISFNNLICKVAAYTQDLELARQSLEQRVEERTQELYQTLENLQKTQAQLVQAEKMSSLGQLVAGVAHEINNPVNFIYGNLSHADEYIQDLLRLLQTYQQHYPNPDPTLQAEAEAIDLDFLAKDLPKLLDSMKVGTERIRHIVLSLRNFSRLDEAEVKPINIHEGLDSTLMILGHRLKAKPNRPDIKIIRDYGNLPLIECYAGQLNQVFMNLLSNAIDALEESIQVQKQSLPCLTIRTAVVDCAQITICIMDNGLGIPKHVQPRLFNPFFTTKPIGKGTGMGLAISYQIVTERHHGSLDFISEPGQGTEFVITMPVKARIAKETAVDC